MSNLKKILAMVLAVTMLLSMGLTAGAGKFSDVKDTDDYSRAINLLASLDVLKGFEDGTYNATGTYTREQFAKILYVLMNGKDDGASMYAGTSPFADVAADRWSAGYINWAKNAKVINGREDGLFWPTDIVTYAEAAKMFVVAMGYDSTVYTFPYGFIDKAQTLKLFDDVNGMTANGPANRGTVAQMAFNALFAAAPRFGTYAAQIGNSSTTETKTFTVAQGAFGMKEAMAYLDGTSTFALDEDFSDEGQVALYSYYDVDTIDGVYDYEGDVDAYVGAKVAVWYKPAKTSNDKDKIFDIQPATDCKMIEFPVTDVNKDTNEEKLIVKLDGVKKTFKWNFEDIDDVWFVDSLGQTIDSDELAIVKGTNNSSTKFKAIDYDGDNDIDMVIVTFADTSKIAALDSTRVTFSAPVGASIITAGSKNIKSDGAVIYNVASDIAKNDYAIVTTKRAYTEAGMKQVFMLTKATKLEDAKLTDIDDGDYIFDGTTYSVAKEASLTDDFTSSVKNVGSTYDLVLNANGKVVFSTKVTSSIKKTDWILLTDYNTVSRVVGENTVAKLSSVVGYLADGTKKTYPVASTLKVNGSSTAFDLIDDDFVALTSQKIYKFELNSDGEVKALKDVEHTGNSDYVGNTGDGDAKYVKSTERLTIDGISSAYLTDDTIIYFYNSDTNKYSVLALSGIKSFDSIDDDDTYTAGQLVKDGSDAVVLLMTGDAKPAPSTDKFGFVVSAKMSASGDDYVYTFKVAYDGKDPVSIKTDAIESNGDFEDMVEATSDGITIGFKKIVFDANGLVDEIVDVDEGDMEAIAVDVSKAASLQGFRLVGDAILANAGDVEYKLANKFNTYPELENVEYADDVNYYVISDYPVMTLTDEDDMDYISDVGIIDKDSAVSAVDQGSILTSSSSLVYVAVVFYNDDDEITDVFCFLDPVVNGTTTYDAP